MKSTIQEKVVSERETETQRRKNKMSEENSESIIFIYGEEFSFGVIKNIFQRKVIST